MELRSTNYSDTFIENQCKTRHHTTSKEQEDNCPNTV